MSFGILRSSRSSFFYPQKSFSLIRRIFCTPSSCWTGNMTDYNFTSEVGITSFNLLAPCYKRTNNIDPTGKRMCESEYPTQWKERAQKTINFLKSEVLPKTSILALQEFWVEKPYFQMYSDFFQEMGYDLRYFQRSGIKADSVALIYNKDLFELKAQSDIVLCRLGDRVAMILWLFHKPSKKNFIIATTHLSFPHRSSDRMLQLNQIRTLTKSLDDFSNEYKIPHATQIVLGDFNADGFTPVCRHLKSQGFICSFQIRHPIHSHLSFQSTLDTSTTNSNSSNVSQLIYDPEIFQLQLHYDHPDSHFSPRPIVAVPDSQESLISAKYPICVSHHNHNGEQVSVDHIFIRPETFPPHSSNPHSTPLPSLSSHDPLNSSDESSFFHSLASNSQLPPSQWFLSSCSLYPLSLPPCPWPSPSQFSVSDHRPISVNLILGERKEKSP